MNIELREDIAQRNIEHLERLHHDKVYAMIRDELHKCSEPTKMQNLNRLLVIREAQIKEEDGE